MALMFLAAMMMAQAPAAAQPGPAQPAVKKHKPPQICEDIEITGSRSKRHVCHDAGVDADLLPGVSHSLYGKGKIDNTSGATAPASAMPPG